MMAKKEKNLLPVPETWGEFLSQMVKDLPTTLLMTVGCILFIMVFAYVWKLL